jgi:hypothetical protein
MSFNFSASVGEIIKGKLARGAGGRFVSAEELQAQQQGIINQIIARLQATAISAPPSAGGKRASRAKTKKKQKKSDSKKKKTRDNLAKVKNKANINNFDALIKFRDGEDIDKEKMMSLVEQGFTEFDTDGNPVMTSAGRSFARAAKRGDIRTAKDATSKAKERTKKVADSIAEKEKSVGNIEASIADAIKEAENAEAEASQTRGLIEKIRKQQQAFRKRQQAEKMKERLEKTKESISRLQQRIGLSQPEEELEEE